MQRIRVFSNNRGLHPRNASNQKHYFSAVTFGTESDAEAAGQHGYPISGFISFPISQALHSSSKQYASCIGDDLVVGNRFLQDYRCDHSA